ASPPPRIAFSRHAVTSRHRKSPQGFLPTELVLRRDRGYRSAYVTYKLLLCKSYPDGTEHIEQISSHPGKERKQAISEYNAYCKSHPGLPHRMDIEKAKWEK